LYKYLLKLGKNMAKVKVEVSARHLHITQSDLEVLFGEGYHLEKIKSLSQPGEFASSALIKIVGPKRELDGLRILGPCRQYTQVELAKSDCVYLGIKAPLRLSGKIEGSGVAKLVGPVGEIELKKGVIVAKRHMHIIPHEALTLGLKTGQEISVALDGERSVVFNKVEVRVNENFSLAVHLDTDEGNAAGIEGEVFGEIII
jgi:putative phosphotransacetylase